MTDLQNMRNPRDVVFTDSDVRKMGRFVLRHCDKKRPQAEPFRGVEEMWAAVAYILFTYPLMCDLGYFDAAKTHADPSEAGNRKDGA